MKAKTLKQELFKTELELSAARKQVDEAYEELKKKFGLSELDKKKKQLKDDLFKAFLEEKLYLPMSELSRYKGKIIESLKFILEDGSVHYLCRSHGMKVNKYGHLYCLHDDEYHRAFYHDGEMYCGWDIKETKNNRYIGFYNVSLLDEEGFKQREEKEFNPEFDYMEDEDTICDKETMYEYLIERS